MPRTDVPPPGQGKRSQRKAWRDNADQAIAIYHLEAAETPKTTATEDSEATSQALPYWDDVVPQPQSQSRSHTYTEEEVKALVEIAYQEGWQEGVEEGYKLGKDKGYKDHKEQEEEEVKNTKNKANEDTRTHKSTQYTPSNVHRVNASTQTDPAAPEACASVSTTHNSTTPQIFGTTATNEPQPLTATSSDPTSLIPLIYSSPNSLTGEIAQITSYNSPTSSDITQDAYLSPENPYNNICDSYVVYFDSQNAPRSNRSDSKKNQPPHIYIPKPTISDTRNQGSSLPLVDVDTQEPPLAFETIPDAEKNPPALPNTSTLPPQQPPLPSMQPLIPRPYRRQDTQHTTSQHPEAPYSDRTLLEKPMITHKTSQSRTSKTTSTNSPVAASEHRILSSFAAPSFVIHAQTVIINNYASTNSSTGENGTTIFGTGCNASPKTPKSGTGNSEDLRRAPFSPTTPVIPPRDLSDLCSRHRRPFSSLQRRSRRRQSMPVRSLNWDSNTHHRNFSRTLQAQGRISLAH